MFDRRHISVRQRPAVIRHSPTRRAKAHVRRQNHAQRQLLILVT